MLSILLFEASVHPDSDKAVYRDRTVPRAVKGEMMAKKANELARASNQPNTPEKNAIRSNRAAAALMGAAVNMYRQNRKELTHTKSFGKDKRISSRVSYGNPPTRLKPRRPKTIKLRRRVA